LKTYCTVRDGHRCFRVAVTEFGSQTWVRVPVGGWYRHWKTLEAAQRWVDSKIAEDAVKGER